MNIVVPPLKLTPKVRITLVVVVVVVAVVPKQKGRRPGPCQQDHTREARFAYICCRTCTWAGRQELRSWVTGSRDSQERAL